MNNYYIHSLFESLVPQPKDIKRIQDIITKSGGDMDKARSLASTMAGKIKDADKMERRFNAAVQELGDSHPVTEEFRKACFAMGIDTGVVPEEDNAEIADTTAQDDSFSTDINAPIPEENIESDEPEEDPDNFSIDMDVEEEISKYEKMHNTLENLYNLSNIQSNEDIKQILNILDDLNNFNDSEEEGNNIVNLYNEIIHNLKITEISKFLPANITVKEIHCIPASYKSWAAYPFKWNIAAPYRLRDDYDRYIPYMENNLPSKNNNGNWVSLSSDSEGISLLSRMPILKTSDDIIFPLLIQAEIYSNTIKKTGKFEFLINPINFNLVKLHSDWYSSNDFIGKYKFLWSFDRTPMSQTGSNGAKLYKLSNEYKYSSKKDGISGNAKEVYNAYILPLHKAIIKLFRNTDNYKEFQQIWEYKTMTNVMINSIISDCEKALYNNIKQIYPEFPSNNPSLGYAGWKIDKESIMNSSVVIAPKLYYTANKVKKHVQDRRGYYIGTRINSYWDELFDYSTNKTKALAGLAANIKKALGAKLFKKCIVSKDLGTIKIPWEILEK